MSKPLFSIGSFMKLIVKGEPLYIRVMDRRWRSGSGYDYYLGEDAQNGAWFKEEKLKEVYAEL